MKDLSVGMAKVDITPKLGCLLYGYPSERPSKRILDNLYVGAVAICQNGETVLIMSADICAISPELTWELQTKISEATGVKAENITYSCIHTHSGPITKTAAGWGTADDEYLAVTLTNGSVEAAKKAVESMQPAVMGIGQSECYAGINRRQEINGEIHLGQNPEGPYDPTMTAMVFKTPEGKYIGTIIHFAMHPTVADGHTLSITRDWPSIMVNTVEGMTKAGCIYINGAEGDVGPRLSNGLTTANESQIPVIGSIAADSAVEAINSISEYKVPEIKVFAEKINLPLAAPSTYDEVCREIEEMGDPATITETRLLRYAKLNKLKEMHENSEEFPKVMEQKQTIIAFDDLALVPFPFEAFCNIALDLRAQSPYKETLLLGLTGGSCAYLPTEDELPKGGYEIASFRGSTVPGFIDSLDKEIVKENVRLLNQLKSK